MGVEWSGNLCGHSYQGQPVNYRCRQRLPPALDTPRFVKSLSKRVGGAWHPGRALLRRYALRHAQEGDLNLTENS